MCIYARMTLSIGMCVCMNVCVYVCVLHQCACATMHVRECELLRVLYSMPVWNKINLGTIV